jgi:glycosyltransferase involved in cell wall biosynthesis
MLRQQGIELLVLYLSQTEPNRSWKFPNINHNYVILPGKTFSVGNAFFHWNSSALITQLRKSKPIAVITSGFDLTMLQAFLWSRISRVVHLSFSDGTLDSERNLGLLRRVARRLVVKNSRSVLGASRKTLSLYQHYGALPQNCFESCLCVDNDRYQTRDQAKEFDLLYVSQFIPRKMPEFIVEVMVELGRDYSLQVVGDGHLREWFINELTREGVGYEYAGFVQPDKIPASFQKARLLLFPTRSDPWGVVANEACAAGVPVLTTSAAGAAGELIIHGENGFVLPPEARVWADHVRQLLNDKELYSNMCRNALSRVRGFTFEKASEGILNAVMASLKK